MAVGNPIVYVLAALGALAAHILLHRRDYGARQLQIGLAVLPCAVILMSLLHFSPVSGSLILSLLIAAWAGLFVETYRRKL